MGQPMTIFDRDAANAIVYEEHEPDEHARSRGIAHRTPRDPSEVVERVAALVSALGAARAEVARLRTAAAAKAGASFDSCDCPACQFMRRKPERTAADERADVIAWLRGMGRGFASHLASEFEQGAHVGAATGGER